MNGNHIGIVIAIIIVFAGGWYLLSGKTAKAPTSETSVSNQMPIIDSATPEMIVENTVPTVTVTYTDQGFSPKEVTVTLGTTVNFVNQSSGNMWVATAPHPAHTAYSGTSLSQHCPDTTSSAFDACEAYATGSSFSFTFNKEGTWKYHDHVNASRFGSVIVTSATVDSSTLITPI
jgi:plastocyanin